MMAVATDEPMSDDKRKTTSVKLHNDVIETARIVVAYRNESMTDLLSNILRPVLVKMEKDEVARRARAGEPIKERGKGKG